WCRRGAELRRAACGTVVVLGIITAVLAWVWFGRGKEQDPVQEREDAGPGTQLTFHHQEPESEHTQPQKTSDNEPMLHAGEDLLTHDTTTQLYTTESSTRHEVDDQGDPFSYEDQSTPKEHPTGEDLVQHHAGDLHHLQKEVHLRQEPLEESTPDVHHSTGLEEQVNEDLGSSDDELVGAGEDLHLSVGAQVTVEDLKPSTVTEEKLVPTSKEENDFIVPDKVLPIGVETGLMHPAHVQDGVTLINGGDERVQKADVTVCLQGNFTNGNAPNVTTSKQVNRSASEKNVDQFDHHKLESYEQSEMDLAVNKLSVTLENTTCAQVNGHITNNVSTESCHAEVAIPQKLEAVILTSQTNPSVDRCVLLHLTNQEGESNDSNGSGSSDNSCFATHSEAKLNDVDPQRTKRVAAVQPIPHNVSLGFRVHYITHSDSQLIAVIGDHEKLGEWESYVPLTSDKDGYWSHSVALPADANVEWKFVMVENGKIKRWEECYNRHLRTVHEDLATQQWWGYP
ncbi:unnamed protein product, partial [Staurois parvus]